MYKKLVAPTLKELFIQELEGMILSGQLKIGEQLPSERELAAMMHISRSAVNDGIVEMARKGFLEVRPRQGTVVADYHKHGTLEILLSIMTYNGGQLPNEEVRSILEMRATLVHFALEKAIPLLSEEQLTLLEEHISQITAETSVVDAATISFEFDHMLSGFSSNTLLPLFFCSFRQPIITLWERYFFRYKNEGMIARNKKLLSAIREKDVHKAQAIITDSIQETIGGSTTIYSALSG